MKAQETEKNIHGNAKVQEKGSRKVKVAFLGLGAAISIMLDAALAIYVINWSKLLSIALFIFLAFFNFSFSIMLSQRILSFFVKPYKLTKLQNMNSKPKVAILYMTMNDVVPESLSTIKQTYPSDVYVLDDSTDLEKRGQIDKIVREQRFTVLRRYNRQGFKAGAINNWIKLHGQTYDYIVLLDADSYLPQDWVESALKYAEEPANSNIAIFQGLINIWNLDNRFIKTLAPLHILGQDVWEKRLANNLDAVFCYGHNVLMRMSHLREIGGFVEGYVSEDFATAVKLAEKGYQSRFIPIHTYEAMPENIRGFIKRQNKWTRGSMEFFSFVKKPNLSFTQRLLLLLTPIGHFSYIIILVAMFLTILGYYSTIAYVVAFATNLLNSNIFYILSIPIFQYVIATSIVSGIILRIKLYQLGISNRTFLKYELLSKAIGAVMLPYEVKSIVKYFSNKKPVFPVTPKNEKALSLRQTLSISKSTILLMILLSLGLIIMNPLGIIYNITWLVPFFISPVIIYLFSRGVYQNNNHHDHSETSTHITTLTSGSPSGVTCLNSQPETISHLMNDVRFDALKLRHPETLMSYKL